MSQDNRDRANQDARNEGDSIEGARKALAEGNYVGKGMTFPESTQVSAETGEPDERATRGDRNEQGDQSRDRQANSATQRNENRERN
ncbi:MAG: hypothetical protein ACYC4J_08145 [Gemmatimonadaceae bacterium]